MNTSDPKWCGHCRKADHSDAECWSTRIVPNHPAPVFDLERMNKALAGPRVTLPDDLKTLKEISAFMRGAAAVAAEMKECRHCGWMCAPNGVPKRAWYPLEQAPKT
jgi:hypothetical protein